MVTPSVRPKSAISTPKREEQSIPPVTPLGVTAGNGYITLTIHESCFSHYVTYAC